MTNQELQVREQAGQLTEAAPLSIKEIVNQVALVQQVMRDVMKEGEHWGKIPGCGDKPALLKAGAEKLGMTFRLAPMFDVKQSNHAHGHREYQVTCTLNARYQGVGSCSTMEGKYRFRTGPKKSTGKPVPKQYWDLRQSNPAKAQEALGGKGFTTAKEDGQWMICEQGERVEHDNPADHYNTVLKMAKKRAHVDAILTATAASDIFTQDIEEFVDDAPTPAKSANPPAERPKTATEPEKPRQEAPSVQQEVESGDKGEWFWAVQIGMPPRDADYKEYSKNRDTIGSLYHDLKTGDKNAQTRLWWLVKSWQPKPYNGKISDADTQTRDALDAFSHWHEEKQKQGVAGMRDAINAPQDDDVPF